VLDGGNENSVATSSNHFGYSYGNSPSEYPTSDRSISVNLGRAYTVIP
jgi:hypothetical protein